MTEEIKATYKGKTIDEMTRGELISALEEMNNLYTNLLEQHNKDLNSLK